VGRKPVLIYIFFKKGTTENQIDVLVNGLHFLMTNKFYEYFDENSLRPNYEVADAGNGQIAARIKTIGIARHPAQMYEAISCIFLSAFLFWIWWKYKENLPEGRLLGWFLIFCFGLRFCFEFLKINQVSFEEKLPINMGQILSIPLFLAGIVILIRSYKLEAALKAKD
jgi:phosphatidylglycerol---prolipoprotein diacylglyceryl transferase